MSALTVLLAPRGVLAGVREVLSDWSGNSLVGGFVWTEPQMFTETSISGVQIQAGRQKAINFQALAASASDYDRVRIAVLVDGTPGAAQVSTEQGQRLALFLESAFGGRPVTRSRLLVARAQEESTVSELAVDGWHNLVIAPEESSGVNQGHSLLYASKDPYERGRHAAVACASVLGMWRGLEDSVLDGQPVLPGSNARLVRAFYRNLDATAVESALRTQITDVGQSLPLPSRSGSTAVYIEDVALASQTMADQLWNKHAGVLRGPREQRPPSTSKPLGALAALQMMFSFLWAALKNAPRNWVNKVTVQLKSATASAIHSVVFGNAPAQYTVVVDGIAPDGLPASWLDMREAVTSLDKVLENSGMQREHEVHADLSALWNDYAAGALTLADGGERVPALPPVQIGTQRGIVRTPREVVPAPTEKFQDIPAHLQASMALGAVEPYDVMGIDNAERRLGRAAGDPNVGMAASNGLRAVQDWKAKFAQSYATAVGNRIGHSIVQTTHELQNVLRAIREAANASDSMAPILNSQKMLSLYVKIILFLALLGIGVAVLLERLSLIGAGAMWITIAIVVVAWFVATLLVFLNGQRELFRMLNARTTMMEQDEINRRNLRLILRDLRRLGDTYSQFLAWSHVVGTVLNEPFGRANRNEAEQQKFVKGLPLNVKLGNAAMDAQVIDTASAQLRQGVFAPGWLNEPWMAALNGAPALLGSRGYELSNNVQLLFAQQGDGDVSLLPLWIAGLDQYGISSSASDQVWAGVLEQLRTTRLDLANSMIATVEQVEDSGVRQSPLPVFMSGITKAGQSLQDQFDGESLTDQGRSAGKTSVEIDAPFSARHGLSVQAGLVQLSQGIPEHEFKVFKATPNGNQWWETSQPATSQAADGQPEQQTKQAPDDLSIPEGFTF